jgi:hypothetical protein
MQIEKNNVEVQVGAPADEGLSFIEGTGLHDLVCIAEHPVDYLT